MKNIILTISEIDNPSKMQELISYLTRVGGFMQKGNQLYCGVGHNADEFKVGKYLYKYINEGLIESVEGLEHVKHYIKLPLSSVAYQVEITDEEGNGTGEFTTAYHHPVLTENGTDCLIRLTDENYKDFTMSYDVDGSPLNVFCNDKFDIELSTNFPQPEIIE